MASSDLPVTIKAWTYTHSGYPQCLQQTDQTPKASFCPTEILVQMHAIALNPVDIQLMNLAIWSLPLPALHQPKTIGCDFAGTVLRAGSEAQYTAGDEVFGVSMAPRGPGCAAEVVVLDTGSAHLMIAKKPPQLSFVQAASLPVVFMTARTTIALVEEYMRVGGASLGRVAVLGGSTSCGMYAIRLARQRGWDVLSTCSGKNVEFVKGLGAGEVIDYTKDSVPDGVRAFAPDAVIDCVGGSDCIGITRRYVTIVGDKTDRTLIGGSMLYLTHPRMLVRWVLGWLGVLGRYDCIIFEKNVTWLAEAVELRPEEVTVDSVFAFSDMKKALEKVARGNVRGKVVVEIK
ncbi:alcohol dehydrogenase [Pseudovirgaria hyperparasitica]|uniref:Alcohol dehydrogenase n=1 Tax=Pseudovirgaria hyperparasitica TaxID=470096 RepID=A0A6A6WID1_9PEZI|nr:alcohol dehydrogenase [Pseudovirgaria hyperparasitica]KAF2760901.1 alcohol dehydrogenase [Pseudovirgaria hyperparasitica]